MENKIIIITGASDGIGAAAARLLQKQGAHVVIVGRSPDKTKAIADELSAEYFIADFSKLSDVRELADKLAIAYPRIDVLINNAGGIFGSRKLTVDGYEQTLQVNHLAHFLLTNLLLDTLVSSKATIINTSSIANILFSDMDIDDLSLAKHYTPNLAYGNAKLANILFTRELHKRYHQHGITTAAFHPGNVRTSFASGSSSLLRIMYQTPLKYLFRLISPEKGADTLLWLLTTKPGNTWKSGGYYYKRKPGKVSPQADDSSLANALWEESARMVRAS